MSKLNEILPKVTKPARYMGGEWNSVVKDWELADIKVALCYPDLYDIGMCNLGLGIIYDLLNQQSDMLAERVFAPWVDMEDELRNETIALFSLETKRPIEDFDILGFSLGTELTYTNVLNVLDLSGIPVFSAERDSSSPLIIAGGSCTLNPEPMADFIDIFVIGDGEEIILEFLKVFKEWKSGGSGEKEDLLREAAKLTGIYVPSFYHVEYQSNGVIDSIEPVVAEAKSAIQRCIISDLPQPLTRPVVPYLEVVHDRGAVEIQRGCSQGCRFCQAGMIYRPVRERPEQEVIKCVNELIKNCGYDEISLLSLSTTDYSGITDVISTILRRHKGQNLTLSLPSLRLDSFSISFANLLQNGKKAGLTFAPEAGTNRLRCAINKDISDEEIVNAISTAWDHGWKSIKLYFMIGLPTETSDDIQGIVNLVRRIRSIGKGRMNVRVNASTFVPKSHTPYQWVAQASEEDLIVKQQLLKSGLKKAGVQLSWQDSKVGLLEGVLSRGDRRLSNVIYKAWQGGCRFDAWSEHFDWEKWQIAFTACNLDPLFYACRERPLDEFLPWSHIDTGISTDFLKKEYERTRTGETTRNCKTESCNFCGLQRSQSNCKVKCGEMAAASKAE